MLVNIVIGASTVRYADFILGTLLGMGAIVIALAGFGYQLTQALRNPSPATLSAAALFVGVPLTLAWFINRDAAAREARPNEPGDATCSACRDTARAAGDHPARDELLARRTRATRFYCIQDAADYFRLVRRALLDARDTVFILGWDIASTIDLEPGGDATEAPDPARRAARVCHQAASRSCVSTS